jgi:hypothetical protein
MLRFAHQFLEQNRQAIQMAQKLREKKLAETEPYGYRTLLLKLLEADFEQGRAFDKETKFSITAYYFTSSGQGVDLSIYYLPSEIISFVAEVNTPLYGPEGTFGQKVTVQKSV